MIVIVITVVSPLIKICASKIVVMSDAITAVFVRLAPRDLPGLWGHVDILDSLVLGDLEVCPDYLVQLDLKDLLEVF